uniref:Integrase, catalytic region, zinc finger, CCHC-type, peptidase aspartic, catalytic n=1 Tax=Tanacetum cinerariifolium TaxID=118510 RepID=A0A6L2NGB1_TANCI|nr:integrase, catalytic region, zinc finger, CCHC-type, peptidase aspartic, catalytic [Tanacetum cinerariifolium]
MVKGRQVIHVDYFINNDLEYLRGGSSSKKYTTSTTKEKASKYDIPGIKDMVPSLWSPIKNQRDLSRDILLVRIEVHSDTKVFTMTMEILPELTSNKLYDRVTRTKKYAELSAAEKIQADYDMKVTNIILQGLPADIYSLVNHHKVAKDLWERVQLLMQGTSLTKKERKCEGHMARKSTQPKRPRNAAWYKEKAMLAEAHEVGQILDEEQLAFLTEDLDTYDSDCDDISNAKSVLIANISNYGSDVMLEVPHSETYLNDMKNQKSQSKMSKKEMDPEAIKDKISNKPIDYVKINKLYEDFGKHLVPQQELTADEAFWYHILNPSTKSSDALPIKIEAPKELPKSQFNANSELICATCGKSMFDGVHDMCLIDFVKIVNSRAKSAKKHKKQNIWKPTGHVFTEIGFKWKPTGRTFTIVGYPDCSLTISLDDMLKTSPICLLLKASKTKSWLWHYRCIRNKQESSHQPKAEDTNMEKQYLLHVDLCGPMRVASINEKRIVED